MMINIQKQTTLGRMEAFFVQPGPKLSLETGIWEVVAKPHELLLLSTGHIRHSITHSGVLKSVHI